jgi:hypothetical protein
VSGQPVSFALLIDWISTTATKLQASGMSRAEAVDKAYELAKYKGLTK